MIWLSEIPWVKPAAIRAFDIGLPLDPFQMKRRLAKIYVSQTSQAGVDTRFALPIETSTLETLWWSGLAILMELEDGG